MSFQFGVMVPSRTADQPVVLGDGLLGPSQDVLSFWGEAVKTTLLPSYNWNAEMFFELLDSLRQRRLTDQQDRRGTSEMPLS